MATKVNFYENYGDKSARERAELIYSNYSSFQGIIEDCKMRLIYEIKAEKERKRSNHKDELGVRIQNLGNYSNPTADEAVLDVMLEGAIKGLNSAEDALEFFESFTLLSEDEKTQEIIEKGQAEACPCLL